MIVSATSIAGHRDQKSTDGSGKCNIVKTGSDKDRIHGVIFEIPRISGRETLVPAVIS
jgi:hypothetical protein